MHIKTVGSYEAKTHLPALLDSVQQGEKVVITRKGIPVAILIPYQEERDSPDEIIKAILKFRSAHHLDGLSITDMKNEGRKY